MKRILIILMLLGGCLGGILPGIVAASPNQTNLSVVVLERKSTDTINDFDLSVLNSIPSSDKNQQMCYGLVK